MTLQPGRRLSRLYRGVAVVVAGAMVAMLVSANIATSASATASVTYGSAGAACPGGTSSAGTSSVVACVPATETLTAGTLHFNSVAPVVFPATQLTGLEQINLASNTMDVTDATGSGDGWTVSLAATLFSDGVDSLPYGASAITATDLATCDTGSSCTVADNTVTQMPVTVPAGTTMPVAEPIYSANTGSGMGAMSTGLDESLYIPSDVGAGSYSATWMYTLSQSPPTIGSSGQAEPPGLPSAPGPVQGLMATPGDHEITLNWAPSTDPNISSYGVDLDGTQVGTVYAPDPGYTIDDVPNGIPAIVSVDQTDLYGQTSALVTATVTPEDAVTMSSGGSSHSPATVTVAANDGYATVSWSAVAGATGYVVCRTPAVAGSSAPACASNQGQGFQVYTGGALDASDTGLLDGTTYHYTVDAQGPWGNALSSPVPAIPEPAPPAPAGVGQTMVSGTPALAWSPVSVPPAAAPVSYRLYLGSTLNHSDILQTYYPVAGLAAGNYTVRAVNGNGQLSGPSATVTVVPPSTTTTTSTTVPTTTSTTTAATTTTSTTTAATTTTTTAPAVPVVLSESGSTISQYGMSGDLLNTSTLAGIANGVITSQDSTGNHALVYADSGTSNAQAVVVDGNGHKVASASVSSSMAYPVFGQDGVVYNFSTDGLEVYSGASLTLQRVIPNTGSELDGYGNGLGGTTVIPANGDPGVTPANGDELAQYNTASGPETGSQQVIAPYLENAFGTGTTQSFWRNAQPVFGQDGNIYMLAWPGEMSSRIPNTDLVAISPTTGLEVNAWQLPAGGSIPLPPGAQMYAAGKYIAIPDMTWANGSVTSQVILFNTTTRTFTDVLVPTLNSYGFASHLQYAAAVSPDGNYLAVENNFGDVAVIDLSTMDVASTWTMAGAPTPNPYADNSITPNIAILGGPSGGTTTTTTAPTTTTTVPLTAWTNTNSSCDVNYTLSSTVGYYWTLATCTGPSEPAGTQLGYSSTQGYEDSVGSGHDSANYGQVSTGDGFAGGATNADEATYGGPATVTADNDTTGTLHYLQLWTFPSMSGYGLAGTWALPTTTAPGAMTFYLTADGSDDSGASNGEALVSSWNGQPATGAIAMVSSNGSTTAYNVDTDQSLWTVPGVAADDDTGGAVSPDGSEILTVGTGATASDGVNIWNINTGTTGDYTNPGSSPTPAVPGPLPTSDFVVWGPQANDGNAIDNTIVVTNTAGSGGDVTSYDEIGIANWEASTNTPPIFPPTVDSNSNVWIPDSNNLDIINNEGTETKVPVLPNGSADHLSSPVAFDGDYAYVAYSSNTGHTTGLYKVALSAPYTVTAVANVPADFDGAAVTQSQGLLWTAGTNGELYSYSPETGGWAPYTTNNGQDPYPVPSSPYVWLQESSPLALFDMSTDQYVGTSLGATPSSSVTDVVQRVAAGLIQPDGAIPGADTWGSGDPVYAATGDLSYSSTDLSIPGGGVPLDFTRTYDAQEAQTQAADHATVPPLGYGWTDNLGMTVAYNSSAQVETVTEASGAQMTYTNLATDTTPPAWCANQVTYSTSGTIVISGPNWCSIAPRFQATLNYNGTGNSNDVWTFVEYQGAPVSYYFNAAGQLTRVTDSAGNYLQSASYTQSQCTTGHCTIWTSYTADDAATGISLVLESSSSGQLESVFDPDSSTQTATFSYVGSGCSSWTGTQVADLCGSVDPGGITAQYTYNVTNPTANLDYDLTGYTQPGATAQTATQYNPDGQVIQQIDPTVDVTTYGYTSDNATLNATLAGGTTTVSTYPDGSGTGEPKNSNAYTFSNNTMVAETVGVGSQYPITTTYKIDPYSLLPLKTTDGDGHITSYSYEPDNVSPISAINLLSSTDAMGNTTQYRYTNDNLLYCEVSPAETAKGDVTCPSSPPALDTPVPGATINYYNANGQMVETVDPLGGTTTYSYTSTNDGVPSGLLYCEVDPASYDLDVQCPATYLDPPMSGTTSYTYDQAGDKTSETDPDGNTTTYAYTDSAHPGMVTSETDQAGTTTSFTYNAAGEITSKIVSFSGDSYTSSTLYAYDAYGRQICQVTPDAAAAGITCPASGPGATVTTYDAAGRIIRTVNPLGGTSLTAYDQTGRPFCTVAPAQIAAGITCPASSSVSDPGATITVYDGAGQATQVTNPLGGVQTTSYDAAGNVQQTVSVSGTSPSVTTDYGYDADNQQTSVEVDPGGVQQATTFQRYDPDGHVYCSVSADNSGSYRCPTWQASWIDTPPSPTQDLPGISTNVTTNFYNANGQLIQSTNPDDQTSIQIVDGDGRVTCSADPANMASWLAANQSSHYPYMCTSDEPGSGYTFSQYDSNGNVLETTDPLDHATTNHYGADNLLLYSENPLGEKIAYCYYYQSCASGAPADSGTADDLFSMTTPTTATDLDGQITYYTYGPDGQITTTTSTAGITTTSYNDAGAVQSVEYSGTASGYSTPHNITYSYNTDGTRHTMIDATGTTTYLYNVTGEVTSQALTALVGTGLSGSTTTYGYNTQGALTSVTYPGNSDPKATYSYDAAGILVSVTDWNGHQITFAHDGDGNPTAQDNNVGSANPKGTSSTTFSYDPADINSDASSTVACSHAGSQTVDQFFSGSGGSTNVDGQLTRYTISYSGPCTNPATYEQDYSYNQDGQLIYQGSSPQGTSPANFGYDSAGDLATISETDSSGNLVSWGQHYDNAGELTSQTPDTGNPGTATTYSYDTLGDQTGSTGGTDASYNYNQAGQMVSADSGQTTYLYDGDGLQAAVTTPSGTSQMVWDTAGQLPLLLSDGTYDYVYGTGSTPVEQIKLSDGTSTFMSYSPSNSTWLTTNASGTETGLWGYDAYGTLTFGTPTSSFGYAGQYTGPSGLDSMRVRQYDPQTGQFTTVDPALASTGQPYGYADGDPVNNADPTGLAAGWLSSAFNWAGNEAQTVGENLVDEGEAAASDVTGLAGVNINPTFSTAAGDFAYEMTAILGQLAMAGEDGLAPATEDSTEGEASAGGSGLNNLSPALQSALRALGLSGGGPVTLDAATDEAGEGTVSVFHGSINNLHDILANGLQNTEDGAYASPYLEPSVDAAEFSGRVIPPGADTGIVESRIPVGLYKAIMAPLEERYGGFSGNLAGRGFTEIHLMTPEQIKLFNDYIVSEPVSASRWEGLCMVSLLK